MGTEARVGSGGRSRVRAGQRGRLPAPPEAPVGVRGASRPRHSPWPFATGSRSRVPPHPPESGVGSRAAAEPAPVFEASAGQGRPRGRRPGARAAARRPPLPPAPGPAASFPPPAWRAAAATARAAGGERNGARLAASPGGGESCSRGARRPPTPGPRGSLHDHPPAWGAVPWRALGPRKARGRRHPGPPTTPGEGGRKENDGRH